MSFVTSPFSPRLLVVILILAVAAPMAAGDKPDPRQQVPFRHIVPSELPQTADGSLDVRQLVVDSSVAQAPVLNEALQGRLGEVVVALDDGDRDHAIRLWREFLLATKSEGPHLDVYGMVQHVVRQSYLEDLAALRFYASRVRYTNDKKKLIREHLNEAEESAAGVVTFCGNDIRRCELIFDLEAAIEALEAELGVAEDNQLANLDLQQHLQQHQEVMQIMSETAKALHDTAMGIIRNLK